jgi:RimJ/RimL family protein N-acetyltransferase
MEPDSESTNPMQEKLIFTPFEKSESIKLAHWIVEENWPFHGSEYPVLDQVCRSISEGFFSGEDNKTFWIYLKDQPEPVGIVCLHELTDITPIFDLRLKSAFRNRGFGRKIVNWLTQYVFTQTDRHRLEGHTRADNFAMQRVFKACGWVKEAYYRKAWPDSSGNYFDAVAYAMLKSDWETGAKTIIDWKDDYKSSPTV